MPALNQFDYFTDIEQAFIKRRGKHLLVGPLDWALMESWQKREIPLRIVLRAIDEVFDTVEKRGENSVTVRSLKYCSDAVERLFKDWSRAGIGKSAASASEIAPAGDEVNFRAHITKCCEQIRTLDFSVLLSVKRDLTQTLKQLEEILENGIDDRIAVTLEKLDNDLDSALVTNIDDVLNDRLKQLIRKELERAGFTVNDGTGAYERIFCKTVRRELNIPRISIYEL